MAEDFPPFAIKGWVLIYVGGSFTFIRRVWWRGFNHCVLVLADGFHRHFLNRFTPYGNRDARSGPPD